jgi:uncharacterized protein
MEDIMNLLRSKQTAELIHVLENDTSLLEYKDGNGTSLLLLSAYYRNPELIQFMVGRRQHFTFFEAAACGLLGPLQEHVRQDASVINTYAPDGFTALGLAAYFGREEVVRFLLEHGADAKLAAGNGSCVAPIHSAVAARDFAIAQRLLEHGADVNARQHGGYTALHSAGLHGDLAMTELLLRYGADRSIRSDEGKTAYDMAMEKSHTPLLGFLVPDAA